MDNSKQFDSVASPLAGVNLIEASAGTGKTYTIAGLYLRSVIEMSVPVEKILVVTFTEAATQELKERIRKRLKEALADFQTGSSGDSFIQAMIDKSGDRSDDIESISDAIRSFDQAGIYTIHGFCQRMLVENAFESGSLFNTELVTDIEVVVKGIIADRWRKYAYSASPLYTAFLKQKNAGPDQLYPLIKEALRSEMRIIPDVDVNDTSGQESILSDVFRTVSDNWRNTKDEVHLLLTEDPGLNRSRYRKAGIGSWISQMNDYFENSYNFIVQPDCFVKFTSGYLASSVKKGFNPPGHLFFELASQLYEVCSELKNVYENNYLAFKLESFRFVKKELIRKKQESGILGFDDLLLNLHKGLLGDNGKLLADNIRRKYQVALIDEFQDTDPVQYDIFKRIFGAGDSVLFMIGDPKQAIYGFRGADIFAYLSASDAASSKYTLSKNYRSEPGIIQAVNTLFENTDNPFIFENIGFPHAQAAGIVPQGDLKTDCDTNVPFRILTLPESDKPLSKEVAESMAASGVASEILKLLTLGRQGKATIGDRNLTERDIAVLVRKNREADDMKEALNRLGIPAIVYSTGNVFNTFDAIELERVLSALASPSDDSLVKSALSTELLGVTGKAMALYESEPEHFDTWKERFYKYHRAWNMSGFIRAFAGFLKDESVIVRLAGYHDAERRCTNLLHLTQLLHQAEKEKMFGPDGLIKWFHTRMAMPPAGDDATQLRLESDAETVKIITIHKSKGLEYPVVFCPYVWSGSASGNNRDYCLFHDKNNRMALTLDVGSGDFDEHSDFQKTETLAEDLRLLYVALTRARSRCYIVWGRVNAMDKTAGAYLFHRDGNSVSMPDSDSSMMQSLDTLVNNSGGTISVDPLPEKSNQMYTPLNETTDSLSLRSFTGAVKSDFRISSFSSLTSGQHQENEDADRDRLTGRNDPGDAEETGDSNTIFSFPRGAGPGSFMHEIFEHYNFCSGDEILEALIEEKLNKYGFDSFWNGTVCSMVKNVLNTPIGIEGSDFCLNQLTNDNRNNELEFYFPISRLTPENLNDVFDNHKISTTDDTASLFSRIERLDFSPVKGFMKGFIDMVFTTEIKGEPRYYIVDWKSNWMGNCPADYSEERLTPVMVREHYILQYHLYTVALNRYLSLRLGNRYSYSDHFGGVFYIFLRGVSSDNGILTGIYHDCPSGELIEDLSSLFWEGQ